MYPTASEQLSTCKSSTLVHWLNLVTNPRVRLCWMKRIKFKATECLIELKYRNQLLRQLNLEMLLLLRSLTIENQLCGLEYIRIGTCLLINLRSDSALILRLTWNPRSHFAWRKLKIWAISKQMFGWWKQRTFLHVRIDWTISTRSNNNIPTKSFNNLLIDGPYKFCSNEGDKEFSSE